MTKINELQENCVDDILSLFYGEKDEISIKAPTGSGKTHMMAMLMHRLLSEDDSFIFLVSSLSKGDLAEQCYKSFKQNSERTFTNLKPYLISTGNENSKNTEYSIHIDWGHNVYVLPTNQFTSTSRIGKESTLVHFILACERERKKLILIRDESHIATNNLNTLKTHFLKTIHFSATPKNDKFDVELSESEAVEAKLIKEVKFIDNSHDELEIGLTKALRHFKSEIIPIYKKQGIVPAFIIQISNMAKGEEQFQAIVEIIEKQGLGWVSFVSDEKKYDTNNALIKSKNKKMWREKIKEHNYPIEVIIFKMVITEGFDIPRACVLYQVRDTSSKILDEQVIGRVRRNPCLTNFDKLDKQTKELFSKAYIYGMKPQTKGSKKVWLRDEELLKENKIIQEFKVPFKSFKLKKIPMENIDISECMQNTLTHKSIFKAYKELNKCDEVLKDKLKDYITDYKKWFDCINNLEAIKEKCEKVVESYEKDYGEVIKIAEGLRSKNYAFMDKTGIFYPFEDCIWTDNKDNEFFYDSEAELEWFKILNNLKRKCAKFVFIDDREIYLFGKNYPYQSNAKFDYYHGSIHTSYPDFIFKDKKDTIHIFEVKSINSKKGGSAEFDKQRYEGKIKQLKKAYLFASKEIEYVFYLPIKQGESWDIYSYENGVEKNMNKAQFEDYLKARNKDS
ncbi:DEAD/DEAH box helicase [Campylobacter helveticus]|uniref:DEAD/DEAH box helicase n=1 Tax=Campylobacter helveticus TaxID=28898 RepID=A0AAX2UGK1_9BACT|nr:DEAD/DEAH box helicase family protein [Campylobacter helveticus]ARE80415.1 type III restriction/modification system, res subunit [Campylobacter helveticus]MCR2054294.1 DEAD/DEAH box helicase family protein [Campylobacter helveticus]TNB55776.1 DEAD/DEAH box helicase [Campylobacter helveticus]TNB59535.1 DEAD/DEAH box helicase [Campylobacter helveticus]TNH33914.1 DEAD/DEAH box helicase [Campylobacter helveticus]